MPVDEATFRRVLGSFPAGVAVVTALGEDGRPRGLTSSAVSAVSLDPALLLVCVDRTSNTLPALRHRRSFVVNFLAEGGDERARRFATKDDDKFRGVSWQPSEVAQGAPILVDDCVAYAECVTVQELEAGDHVVLLASIEGGDAVVDRTPLVFLRGVYRAWPLDGPVLARTAGAAP